MSKKCDVCGKGPMFGHNVSHANNKTNRRFNPNLQKLRVIVKGSIKTKKVCTRCLKAGKITKAICQPVTNPRSSAGFISPDSHS